MNEAQFLIGLGLIFEPTRAGLSAPYINRNIGTCDRIRGAEPGNYYFDRDLDGRVFIHQFKGATS